MSELSEEAVQTALERLERWSGLKLDRALLEQALARDEELAAEVAEGYPPVRELRDQVAQVLIGQDWPQPDALQPIAEAAAARGLAFTPVAEAVALSPAELEEVRDTVREWYALVCSPELILETFRQEPDVYADYVECERALAGDTALRETFLEVVCQRLVGRSWPIYADSDETQRAFHQALEAAVRPGYLELDPDPEAVVDRAARRRQWGDLEGALELVEQVLAADPEHRNARFQRAAVRYAQGEHAAALPDLDALLDEEPAFMPAVRLRGLALAGLGRTAEAIEALQGFVDHLEPPPDAERQRVVRRIAGMSPAVLARTKAKLAELRGEG